jgi:hypothetical protein
MRRLLRWSAAAAVAALAFAALPAAATAAEAPVIEWTNAWNITPSDATLGAGIDVESLEHGAYYQFQVVANTSEYLPEIACPVHLPPTVDGCMGTPTPGALPIGFIPSDTMGPARSESVSVDLAGAGMTLKPGMTYHYRVLAVKRVQSEDTLNWQGPPVVGPDQTFTTQPAGKAPVIDSVSISHLTPTDATLEAQIDTEGLPTIYQFQLWSICGGGGGVCLYEINYPLPSGLLDGSFVDQSVSLDLNSAGVTPRPGHTYFYSVSATSIAGATEGSAQSFTTPEEGVFEPLGNTTSSTTSSPSGGDKPAVPAGGGQASGSGTPSSSGHTTSNPLGGQSKTGTSKHTHKPKHKHKHHGKKAAKRRA